MTTPRYLAFRDELLDYPLLSSSTKVTLAARRLFPVDHPPGRRAIQRVLPLVHENDYRRAIDELNADPAFEIDRRRCASKDRDGEPFKIVRAPEWADPHPRHGNRALLPVDVASKLRHKGAYDAIIQAAWFHREQNRRCAVQIGDEALTLFLPFGEDKQRRLRLKNLKAGVFEKHPAKLHPHLPIITLPNALEGATARLDYEEHPGGVAFGFTEEQTARIRPIAGTTLRVYGYEDQEWKISDHLAPHDDLPVILGRIIDEATKARFGHVEDADARRLAASKIGRPTVLRADVVLEILEAHSADTSRGLRGYFGRTPRILREDSADTAPEEHSPNAPEAQESLSPQSGKDQTSGAKSRSDGIPLWEDEEADQEQRSSEACGVHQERPVGDDVAEAPTAPAGERKSCTSSESSSAKNSNPAPTAVEKIAAEHVGQKPAWQYSGPISTVEGAYLETLHSEGAEQAHADLIAAVDRQRDTWPKLDVFDLHGDLTSARRRRSAPAEDYSDIPF